MVSSRQNRKSPKQAVDLAPRDVDSKPERSMERSNFAEPL